ncbi:MAG: WecB/TagA/CpsF family glycosyltransferase [Bacteroidaceae bacterium]|nr:WecB/TagA/CpsF family glycosyltransferase [Bacteroidaceae bacterium]
MSFRLKTLCIVCSPEELTCIPNGKTLINTIYAYSYVVAQKDAFFAEALNRCDYLMPDGAGIVKACRWLKTKSQPKERIAGWDLFMFEMQALNRKTTKSKVMFLGSSEKVLSLIRERAAIDFPNLEVVTYSPPYKSEFSDEDNQAMIKAINDANPDLLWIGMTAPKQEKWTYKHWDKLDIHCHCGCIGAVFDFYAGTVKRAPLWWQKHSLEWLYRLLMEPRRMWRRYIIGNAKFLYYIYKERK